MKIYLSGMMILLAFLGLVGCGNQAKNQPVLNPHPKYFVVISGNIQPDMKYPIHYLLKAIYAGYNPKCKVWINHFEGVKGLPSHKDYYVAKPNAKGNYQIKIPIDRYKSGPCDWKIAALMIGLKQKLPPKEDWDNGIAIGWSDSIHFGRVDSKNELPGLPMVSHATVYCGKYGADGKTGYGDGCRGSGLASGYSNHDVPRNHSYYYTQNIKAKREKA